MTERIGDFVLIVEEKPQQCDFCGEIRELRPYGPNKECICFDCGEKNKESTHKQMFIQLFDCNVPEGFE